MEDYEKLYKDVLAKAREIHRNENEKRSDMEWLFPELKESEDEKIRKALVRFHKSTIDIDGIKGTDILAWLEKQGESYTKNDVDDAYLKGICDAKHELEKQGTSAKLSEEEQNSFAKGVLSRCALSFIDYLDAHSYEGKMCVSNGECEDIENAFHNAMWDRLHRYYCKYIEKQGEQKPILDFKASNWYVSKVDGKIHDMTYNPTDRAEPKFKVGDYIVSDYCMGRVIEITNDAYLLDTGQGIPFSCQSTRLWDIIKDAKKGDVLHSIGFHNDCIFIFNGLDNDGYREVATGYCCIFVSADKIEFGIQGPDGIEIDTVKPATKIQRDLLFQKMKEAGYEFDFEKKELKKIENEIEIPFGAKDSELQEETYYIPKGFHAEIDDDKVVIKKGEKSAAWSEEEEGIILSIEQVINAASLLNIVSEKLDKIDKWLKSLKDRIGV